MTQGRRMLVATLEQANWRTASRVASMHPFFALPAVSADRWQMQQGERFALEGLLAQLRPRLAIEVGTFEGGSLRRIATYAEHVHAFDVDPKVAELAGEFDNVTFHIGDSAELLPLVLADLGARRPPRRLRLDRRRTHARGGARRRRCPARRRRMPPDHHRLPRLRPRRRACRAGASSTWPGTPRSRSHCSTACRATSFSSISDPELVGQAFNGLALVVLDADRDPRVRGYDAPEFVGVRELHRAYAAGTGAGSAVTGEGWGGGVCCGRQCAPRGCRRGGRERSDRPLASLIRAAEDLS